MATPDFTLDRGRIVGVGRCWRAVCNVAHLIYAVYALAVAVILGR